MRVWMAQRRGQRTQQQIAREAGVTQSCYCMIENGKRLPRKATAKRIARALGVDWRMFYDEEDEEEDHGMD